MIRDLGNGLILRHATHADTERLAAFNATIHGSTALPSRGIAGWAEDLLSGNHPTTNARDFTLVEDTRSGEIVSSLGLINQTWRYADIEFGVGRVELVGTHPDYRRRGLVRAQFEVIHELSKTYGQKAQVVEGLPWFYRQFGYEPALEAGGGRFGYLPHIPELNANQSEPFRIRSAAQSDIPFLDEVYTAATRRYLVTSQRDHAQWQYEIQGRTPENLNYQEVRIIESATGTSVGFFIHPNTLWGAALAVTVYEIKSGASWQEITPSVLRYLQMTGQRYATQHQATFDSFGFWFGSSHPVYEISSDQLPITYPPRSWYVRIPAWPDFVRDLTSVLERRLAASVLAGHTGELRISFYRNGIKLIFDRGKLKSVTAWQSETVQDGDARFPDSTFLQLLFGYRSISELQYAFADCKADKATSLLINIVFPKEASSIWPFE